MSGRGDSSIYKSGSEFPGYIHKTTPRFWDGYQRLPTDIQNLADKQSERLKEDPTHPSLIRTSVTTSTQKSIMTQESRQLSQLATSLFLGIPL